MTSPADSEKYEFAGLRLERGQRARTRIRLAELADGSSLELPVMIIRGAQPGPVFYIGAGLHGDEVAGVQIVGRLITQLATRSSSFSSAAWRWPHSQSASIIGSKLSPSDVAV